MNVFKKTNLSTKCRDSLPYLAGVNAGILAGFACVAAAVIWAKMLDYLTDILIPNAILKPLGLLDESDFED